MHMQKEYNKSELLLTAADIKKIYMLKSTWLASLVMVPNYLAIYDMIKRTCLAGWIAT